MNGVHSLPPDGSCRIVSVNGYGVPRKEGISPKPDAVTGKRAGLHELRFLCEKRLPFKAFAGPGVKLTATPRAAANG